MKKIFISFFVVLFFFTWLSADYNWDKTVTSEQPDISSIHPSWDLDFDWVNDCESSNTCDHTVDYSSPKTYTSKSDFLDSEAGICNSATDGCNSIGIFDWAFGVSTEIYCEDIYGEGWQEVYSCTSYNEDRLKYNKYIYANIASLTEQKPVLGGSWFVTNVEWDLYDSNVVIDYEDGHIIWQITLTKKQLQKAIDNDKDSKICTMEYNPVCAELQVQCIKAPCNPVQQTFSNSCMAGDNPILYHGQCNSFVDVVAYNRYMQMQDKLSKIVKPVSDDVLESAISRIDRMIDDYLSTKKQISLIKKRITQLVFIKHLMSEELKNR